MRLSARCIHLYCLFGLSVFPAAVHGQTDYRFQGGHLDLYVSYHENLDTWSWQVDSGAFTGIGPFFAPDESLLEATSAARVNVPTGSFANAYSFIGPPGTLFWDLPEADILGDGMLEPGFDAGGVPLGVFTGLSANGRIAIDLVDFSGPGNFFLYAIDSFTFLPGPLLFDTRDGIAPYGTVEIGAGDHAHYNWDFTARGIYLLTLKASGTLVEGGTSESDETVFVFLVEPDPIDVWRAAVFYDRSRSPEAEDEADGDGDGLSVLEEYAYDGNPLVADASDVGPGMEMNYSGGQLTDAGISYRMVDSATDLTYTPKYSIDLVEWFEVPAENIAAGTPVDGITPVTATMPVSGDRMFFTVEITRFASY